VRIFSKTIPTHAHSQHASTHKRTCSFKQTHTYTHTHSLTHASLSVMFTCGIAVHLSAKQVEMEATGDAVVESPVRVGPGVPLGTLPPASLHVKASIPLIMTGDRDQLSNASNFAYEQTINATATRPGQSKRPTLSLSMFRAPIAVADASASPDAARATISSPLAVTDTSATLTSTRISPSNRHQLSFSFAQAVASSSGAPPAAAGGPLPYVAAPSSVTATTTRPRMRSTLNTVSFHASQGGPAAAAHQNGMAPAVDAAAYAGSLSSSEPASMRLAVSMDPPVGARASTLDVSEVMGTSTLTSSTYPHVYATKSDRDRDSK
jgi:hypothetical protein